MDTFTVLAKRCSCREYKKEQITDEQLKKVLQAANAAPIGNALYDTLKMTVIQNEELLAEIDEEGSKFFGDPAIRPLYGAPTLIMISGSAADEDDMQISLCNASCMIENMSLACTELGLGSVYIMGNTKAIRGNEAIKKKLGVPKGFALLAGIAVGYPTSEAPQRELVTDKIETLYLK